MKKIEAIIRPIKLDAVRLALQELGINDMIITEIKGHVHQSEEYIIYRGVRQPIDIMSSIKIEVVIQSELVDECISAISLAARTGHVGDGKIFVTEIQRSIRIRTEDDLSK